VAVQRVDHAARREVLTGAVWSLIARGGVEAVSLRTTATEAGVSMGRVQYYFPSKDELLLHALEQAHRRMERRVEARVAELGGGDDHAVLAAILTELLGDHPETRDAIRVHAAFAASAPDPRRTAVLTDGDAEILALAVAVVRRARDEEIVDDVDPDVDGYGLVVLAGALGAEVALRDAPVERARAVLDRQFRRVTGRPLAPA
jgi:DNA-binding transcriptional regulator YbjK